MAKHIDTIEYTYASYGKDCFTSANGQRFVAYVARTSLPLNAPIATKVVCFSRLLKCLRSLYGNSEDPDKTALIRAVCSGSTLFASILNSSVMLGNDLQQTTSADDIFRCIFCVRILNDDQSIVVSKMHSNEAILFFL